MARTTWGVFLIIAIGAATLMFTLSGYGGMYQENPTDGLGPVGDAVQDEAANSSVNSGVEGAASSTDEPLINFVLSGAGALLTTAKLVLFLPVALSNLGFPIWFAGPVGAVIQIGTGIGIIQFISGRVYR